MDQQPAPEGRDPQLWQLAQRRAAFKRHLASYLSVNALLWLIWFFTDRHDRGGIPWPIWPTFGWGIAIVLQYFGAYVNTGYGSAEEEYRQLEQRNFRKQ